jgi:hypothetical protein
VSPNKGFKDEISNKYHLFPIDGLADNVTKLMSVHRWDRSQCVVMILEGQTARTND